jgi:hypothetical protein
MRDSKMNGNSGSNMMRRIRKQRHDFQQQEKNTGADARSLESTPDDAGLPGPMAPAMPPASTAPTTYNQMQMTPLPPST